MNDAPVFAVGAITRKISGNISQPIAGIGISDIDVAETLNSTVQVTLTAAKGVLTLGTTTGLVGATNGSNITFSGTIANVNAALTTLSYKGNPNVFGLGADTINLTVNDLDNTGSGGSLTDSKAIALNIYNTQNGTNGDDTFSATSFLDEILLGAGNDRVLADIFNLQQNDILDGGIGSDRLVVLGGTATDSLTLNISNTGIDLLTGLPGLSGTTITNFESFDFTNFLGSLNATGSSLADEIVGGQGNDILDGGAGNDILVGGLGNDRYIVDSTGDIVTELANQGVDTVVSSVTWSLGLNIENLTLTGTGDLNGTGNSLGNVITGNSGNNILDGGTNADTLIGGAGNDTYVIDNSSDIVTELAGEGTDTIISSITRTLGANIENLTLTGSSVINGTGNELDNIMGGNNQNNILDGGAGADKLSGGDGNDTLTGGLGADTLIGGLGNDTLNLGQNDGAIDKVVYNSGDGSDSVNQFVRGLGGDLLQFNGINSIDVRTVGANTQFRLGDGISGNAGFGTGSLLLTLNGVNGFNTGNINDNILAGSLPTTFKFS